MVTRSTHPECPENPRLPGVPTFNQVVLSLQDPDDINLELSAATP